MPNSSLCRAKVVKNDEFYTRYDDVAAEMEAHATIFAGKTVYLNCDHPSRSAFWSYFHHAFRRLHLKKLIATCLADAGEGKAYFFDGSHDMAIPLASNGDFRSPAVLPFLKMADIIVSNPPYSIILDYLLLLLHYGKPFLILTPMTAIIHKEIFPYVQDGRIRMEAHRTCAFFFPMGDILHMGNVHWIAHLPNLESPAFPEGWHTMRENLGSNQKLQRLLDRDYGHHLCYQPYFNCDGIDIPLVDAIPSDFTGLMGVPISFLSQFNPKEFELLGIGKYRQCTTYPAHGDGRSSFFGTSLIS